MKRLSYAAAVCSIAVISTLFAVSVFGATEKASSKPNTGVMNTKADLAQTLTGKVVETMDSGGYSYICLEQKGKKTWFAVPQMAVTKGQAMTFALGMEMKNFTSKTLKRTFDSIYFADGPITGQPGGASRTAPANHGTKAAPAATNAKISVKKAAGKNAYTVAEVFAKKDSLNEKPAVIRGKVVKVSSGIMGKNWIHLQDGTGEAAKGTNDLIATSQDSPAVGDIVTVKGTVYKDKDFGAGYKYQVIMEQAKVQR